MSAKHTPGPWKWFGNLKSNDIYLATVHSGRRFVMQFSRWGMGGAQPLFQVTRDGDGLMTRASELAVKEVSYRADIVGIDHPDARLIAAAPELLEALRDVMAEVAGDGRACLLCGTRGDISCCPEVLAARAAIAKAEGSADRGLYTAIEVLNAAIAKAEEP